MLNDDSSIEYEDNFPLRLARLRSERGISAREMSLGLGQNPGYINTIESGKALPSMSGFFYICDYLQITPVEFFDDKTEQPKELRIFIENITRLDTHTFNHIAAIVEKLASHRR